MFIRYRNLVISLRHIKTVEFIDGWRPQTFINSHMYNHANKKEADEFRGFLLKHLNVTAEYKKSAAEIPISVNEYNFRDFCKKDE